MPLLLILPFREDPAKQGGGSSGYNNGMSIPAPAVLDPVPAAIDDPINAAILRVSEDTLQGFQADPFGEIAALSGSPVGTVIERIRAMLRAGTIRRVRQTLMATNLAQGSLVAWQVPEERLTAAFDYHVRAGPVLRPRRHPHRRPRLPRRPLPPLDHAESPARLLA